MSELWAIKVGGDVYPAPSRDEAEAKVRELSTFLARINVPNVPSVETIRWDGPEAEHQQGLSEWAPAQPN